MIEVTLIGGPLDAHVRIVLDQVGGYPYSHYHENGFWYRWNIELKHYEYVGVSWKGI